VDRRFAYYPGCALHGSSREYDLATREVCRALGIELEELQGWICCGASSAHHLDTVLAVALPSHELKQAAEKDLPLLAPCALCFSRLRFALKGLEDPALRSRVEEVVGRIPAPPPVYHLLEVLAAADIPVERPLQFRAVCYYGCLLTRPPEIARMDDPENPMLMDRILNALGAEVIPWGFKTECCGAGLPLALPGLVYHLSRRILRQARDCGAEAIVVACPMCHSNLDLYQEEISRQYGEDLRLPVIYISQAVGLALNLPPERLGLDRHMADTRPLIKGRN